MKRALPTTTKAPPEKKRIVERGLQREKEMLALAAKDKLGPTMQCVFSDAAKDPLAAIKGDEWAALQRAMLKRMQARAALKPGAKPPPVALSKDEQAAVKLADAAQLSKTEQKAVEKLSDDLETKLQPWMTLPTDELGKLKPDAKKVLTLAHDELGEEVLFTPGDDLLDEVDLEVYEEPEEDDKDTRPLPPLTIDFMDVGMGDCALFVCGDGTTVLIDCGTASRSPEPGQDTVTFLEARLEQLRKLRGLKKPHIDRVYLTHPDRDHYNLLPSLFHEVPRLTVGEFHIGGEQKDYKQTNDVFGVDKNAKKGKKQLLSYGDIFGKADDVVTYDAGFKGEKKPSLVSEPGPTGGPVSFRVLCANTAPLHRETWQNAASVVVLVEMAGERPGDPPVKILMMGDGEQTVEERLLKEHADAIQNSTILHIGHHGAEKAATKSFLERVDPRIAQISADQNWAHPYRTTVERITTNPKLRVNEALENDPTYSIVVGEGANKTKVHTQEETTSALIMNIGHQEKDTSGSAKAKAAKKDGQTPMVVHGQQWRVEFQSDGSLTTTGTLDDPDMVFLQPEKKK